MLHNFRNKLYNSLIKRVSCFDKWILLREGVASLPVETNLAQKHSKEMQNLTFIIRLADACHFTGLYN
jgi:hypothetical protein